MMMVTERLQCRAFLVAGQINTTNCQADKRLSIYQPLSWIALPQTKQTKLDETFGYSARMHAAYYAVHIT